MDPVAGVLLELGCGFDGVGIVLVVVVVDMVVGCVLCCAMLCYRVVSVCLIVRVCPVDGKERGE